MAKVELTQADSWHRQVDDWAYARLHGHRKELHQLAIYLNVTDDTIYKRISGFTEWRLDDALAVLDFFGSSPSEVMK